MKEFTYIDAHCHLQESIFDEDRDAVVAHMKEARVAGIVIGYDRVSSEKAIQLAGQYDNLWAIVGQHPTDDEPSNFDAAWLRDMVQHDRVVGIGECGFDFYRGLPEDLDNEQEGLFRAQIEIALEYDKPLMMHIRPSRDTYDAYEKTLQVLNEYKNEEKLRGNAHFFVGSSDIAERFQELGFTVSFSGVITFSQEYDEVVRTVPADMILAETDAPFVAPVPHRGQRAEPVHVIEVYKKLAELRGDDPETLRQQIVANITKMFF